MLNQEIQALADRLLAKVSLSLSDADKQTFLEKAIPVVLSRAVTRLLDATNEGEKPGLAAILENENVEESIAQLSQRPGFLQAVEVEIDNYAVDLENRLDR